MRSDYGIKVTSYLIRKVIGIDSCLQDIVAERYLISKLYTNIKNTKNMMKPISQKS